MRKRVPAAVLAVLLAWSMAAPALAAEEGGTEYVSQDTFWNWLSGNTSGILHKQSVTMQYDDTGQLIQQGYTIYQCVACGEQYKSQDGTGPPGGSSDGGEEEGSGLLDKLGELLGSGAGGFLKLMAAFLGGILDGLIALVNVIVEKLGEVIAAVNQIFLGNTSALYRLPGLSSSDISVPSSGNYAAADLRHGSRCLCRHY